MEPTYFLKKRLFSPGPTPVPLRSQWLSIENTPYHRTESFYSLFSNCLEFLKVFFGTGTLPLILTSSGTGAMEAAFVNLTEPGDRVLVIKGGRFGERWMHMAKAYGCECEVLSVPPGEVVTRELLEARLKRMPKLKAAFFEGVETATGVYFPVQEIARCLRENTDAFVVVDAISSILCHEMRMDEWGIDCVVAASQKGFGVAPGLSFLALSPKAQKHISSRPKFYFDLQVEIKNQSSGKTTWTPNTQHILTLHASLQALLAIGREGLYGYHERLTKAVRSSLVNMGLELFAKDHFAHSVTAFSLPHPIEASKVKLLLNDKFNIIIAGGQDQLKGKILRLAHMTFIDPFDILGALGALELILNHFGLKVFGKGTGAFMEHFPLAQSK